MSKANGSEALVAEQLSKDRAVIELCRRSLVNHFVVRDMDAALAYMADDVEWLGPFSCQTASDKKTMEDILRPEYSIRLALADERWRARKRANTWIVSARYTLLVVSAGGERSMPFKQHATYAGRTSHRASARVERHRCEPALAFARSWPERHRIPVRALRCPGIRRRQAQLPRHGRRRSRSASQRTVR